MKTRSILALAAAMAPGALWAQFNSGSTGADGALTFTTPGTYDFDPAALNINAAGDNVFNFTTITIGQNVTLRLRASLVRNKSVIWLAQGAVTINGVLSLNGAAGPSMSASNPGLTRSPAEPGPGGFPGGVGQYLNSPANAGAGYGGGAAGDNVNCNGRSASYLYTNAQLVPLLGGPGGGGGLKGNWTAGDNGGAGGGAIRIVSSSSITINSTGYITASGGGAGGGLGGCGGGSGSGGAIHLVAPTVTGTGSLFAGGGATGGIIKISASTNTFAGQVNVTSVTGGLYNPPLPAGLPLVRVVSVNGVNAPTFPTASYLVPDVTINSSTPVTVAIAANNLPTGTVVKLYLTSEQGNDTVINCDPLAGTLASSTANCNSTPFPPGVTISLIRALW